MLLQASTLLNLPVAANDTQSKIGKINKVIINPDNGELMGFIIKQNKFFAKDKILSSQDTIEIDRNGIVTPTEENLLEIDEIVRIKEIINQNIPIFGQNAITESKQNIGKINDFLIDTDMNTIVKFYIHGIFHDKIFPANKVIRIDKNAVVFSDDVVEQTPSAETEGAAA